MREDVTVTAADLLRVPAGDITLAGIRNNLDVGIRYLAAWLGGNGCVPIHHLMEDAATAEISRAQLWQWVRHELPPERNANRVAGSGSRTAGGATGEDPRRSRRVRHLPAVTTRAQRSSWTS